MPTLRIPIKGAEHIMGATIEKNFPPKPTFFECGCCGGLHWEGLPGAVDCRDDAHRFTFDELDSFYGPIGWEEVTVEDQMDAENQNV